MRDKFKYDIEVTVGSLLKKVQYLTDIFQHKISWLEKIYAT